MRLRDNIAHYVRIGLFGRERQPESQWHTLTPTYALTNERAFVMEGFRRNSAVRRCTDILATCAASVPLKGYQKTPEGETEIAERDPLRTLLARPGGDTDGSSREFLRMAVLRLMLLGEVICYKVPGQRSGRTVELQFLGSSHIEVRHSTERGKFYVYRPDGTRAIPLSTDEVMFLKLSDPYEPDRGISPLASAARETDTDNEATDFRKAFFENGAITSGLLTTEQDEDPETLKKWSSDWKRNYSGSKNAGKTPVLAGGLTYQKVGANPGEIAMPDLTNISEARIHQVFGVSPILTGSMAGLRNSTYNNYRNARVSLWEDTVTPLLSVFADWFTEGLTEPADSREIRFDLSEVPALKEDAQRVEERYGRALQRGAITVNEYREKIGMDSLGDGGDVFLRPQSAEVVES